MKSLKKLAYIADKFERKLAQTTPLGAPPPTTSETNQRPVIMDAFFGAGKEQDFLKQINQPNSNFNQAAGDVQGKISINVQVDAATQTASFVVSPNLPKLENALVNDYIAVFKVDPKTQFKGRLAKKDLRPLDVSGTTDLVTM